MRSTMLTAAFMLTAAVVAVAAYAASPTTHKFSPPTTHKFSPPTISKQQEQAYNQTYKSDKAQELLLKAHGG